MLRISVIRARVPDLDGYINKLPNYRFTQSFEFEFLIEDAQGSKVIHQEKVESLETEGVKLIIGGGWSDQAKESLQYVNDNNLLLFSNSSTSSGLSIADDNLFRMCPDNLHQSPAMAEMVKTKGIDAVIIMNIDNEFGNDLHDVFKAAYQAIGGTVHAQVKFPDQPDYGDLMDSAEAHAQAAVVQYGADKVGVVLIGYIQNYTIVEMAKDYNILYSLTWFGPEAWGRNEELLAANPEQCCQLKLFSTFFAPMRSSKYDIMKGRWNNLFPTHQFDYYAACKIDIAWVLAMAVLETARSQPHQWEAGDIIKVIPDVVSRYFGYSGWAPLNGEGDRAESDYDIWGYGYDDDDNPSIWQYGKYDGMPPQITWFQTPIPLS